MLPIGSPICRVAGFADCLRSFVACFLWACCEFYLCSLFMKNVV